MTIAERRGLRGVVNHVLRAPRYLRVRKGVGYSRAAVGLLSAPYGKRPTGCCVWCRRPTRTNRHRWHPACILFYSAARGLVNSNNTNAPLLRQFWTVDGDPMPSDGGTGPIPCAECGKGYSEIDHHLPLSVADELGLRWSARARLPGNLRPLCRACHRIKTKRDRALLAALRRDHTQGRLLA